MKSAAMAVAPIRNMLLLHVLMRLILLLWHTGVVAALPRIIRMAGDLCAGSALGAFGLCSD